MNKVPVKGKIFQVHPECHQNIYSGFTAADQGIEPTLHVFRNPCFAFETGMVV